MYGVPTQDWVKDGNFDYRSLTSKLFQLSLTENLNKSQCTLNILIFNGEMLKTFPMGLESPASFKIVLEVLDNKQRKRTKIIREEIKLLLFIVGIIVYTESQRPSTGNTAELEFLTDFFSSVRFT